MNEESRRIAGNDARALLDNKLFRSAFDGVAEHLENVALTCNPDDKEKAQRVVIAKQILAGIKREIVRVIEDGTVAEIQLSEIERKKSITERFFNR